MGNVIGIPNTRVSDLFVRQRLLNQVTSDQVDLFRIQSQLSTGRRIMAPSDDPVAAMRIVSLQRLLERKDQVQTNLATNQSFLSATDTALSSVNALVADVRGAALEVIGTVAGDAQRLAAAQQVRQAIQQLTDTGNQNFRGRYLFAGSLTGVRPFEPLTQDVIQYLGNEGLLESYGDIDLLFATNLTGDEVFGAISEPVRGTADLDPVLTYDTRLADLNGGRGVTSGGFEVSNGAASKVVDITGCETIGDVAARMLANQPAGSQLYVDITPKGLEISLSAGTLSIKEVRGGTTASELGILAKQGVGLGPLVGRDLDPIVRSTTRLDDSFGARARAVVRSPGQDNDLVVEARVRGDAYNGVAVRFYDDGTVLEPGQEWAWYDPAAPTPTVWVNIKTGYTKAVEAVAAINAAYDPLNPDVFPFRAALDPLDSAGGGRGLVDVGATGQLKHGAGFDFDQDSGVQIVNGMDTFTLTFSQADGVTTVEDLLNVFNGSAANVVASINAAKTGIDVRSRLSGCDFSISENGGRTASDLGLRTFNLDTRLEDLGFGLGVHDYTGTGAQASALWNSPGENSRLIVRARQTGAEWNDFSVRFVEKVPPGPATLAYDPTAKTLVFSINPGETTANDVMELLRQTPGARDDFEIVLDASEGQPNDGSGAVASSASATAAFHWGGVNNDLVLKARSPGSDWNGVAVSVVAGAPGLAYNRAAKTMVFSVNPGVTTAQNMIDWLQADADANADFAMYIDADDQDASQPVGAVWPEPTKYTAGGAVLTPAETAGGFAADADFTITRTDGVSFEINVHGATTIRDVVDRINTNPVNTAPGGTAVVARLAAYGNGIELVDNSAGSGTLTVTRTRLSRAAIDLGLIPEGQTSAATTAAGACAAATFDFGVPNSGLVVRARGTGTVANGVTVRFEDMAAPGPGVPDYAYDPGTRTLTFWVNPAVTTANQVVSLFHQQPPLDATAAALFEVELDTSQGPNTGAGAVNVDTELMSGGEPDLLTGRDVNPQETEGLFTALLRLYRGLIDNDNWEIQRSVDMLDVRVTDLNFSRAALGARQQGLDVLGRRLEDENVQLRESLSADFDVDMVQAISDFSARQAAYEASLRSIAQIFQMSLLNYI